MKTSRGKGLLAGVALMLPLAAVAAAPADTISVERAFVEIPAKTLDLLSRSARLDMLDYYAADSIYQAPNAMEGLSSLKTVGKDYIALRITPVTTLQLKVLKDKKGNDVVMSVYTVGADGQAPDSDVRFYSVRMEELPVAKYFVYPKLADFFEIPKGSLTKMKEIESLIPFPTIEYVADSDSSDLKARLTVGEFMTQDDYNIVKLFLRPEITLRWDGSKYKLTK